MFPRIKKQQILIFLVGLLLGYELSTHSYQMVHPVDDQWSVDSDQDSQDLDQDSRDQWSAESLLHEDTAHQHLENDTDLNHVINFEDLKEHRDDARIALSLFNSVRVLCWVMTSPKNLKIKAAHVKATWGKRCNKLLFMSDTEDVNFPAVGLDVKYGRSHLTAKTMRAFDYIYQNHYDDADWFLKADDDTYVIVENLRYLLSAHSHTAPVFFGQLFTPSEQLGYFSGGAGYVISKEALKRFGERDPKTCAADRGAEDVQLGICLTKLGVKTGNSRDKLNRSRFHALRLRDHLQGRYPDWYKKYDMYSNKRGIESISDYPITFHYVGPKDMYVMEYYVYHAAVYGILRGLQQLNTVNNTNT